MPKSLSIRTPALAAAAATVALALFGCSDRNSSPAAGVFKPKAAGVLTVVTSAVPSSGFWEGTAAHPTGGFEYELARDFARRFGLRSVRIELEPFAQIVAGKLDGADMALDLITPTPVRERNLDFSQQYLNAPPTVVARAGAEVPDLESAQPLRWGALRGTTLVGIVNELITPDAPVRTYPSDAPMLAAIKDHRIDAAVFDLPYAVAIADRSHGQLEAVAQLPVNESIAAALPKGSANAEAVDSAIRAFTADGTITALLRRWIGADAADAEKSIPLLRTER